jgi:hypothetical protein
VNPLRFVAYNATLSVELTCRVPPVMPPLAASDGAPVKVGDRGIEPGFTGRARLSGERSRTR